jgi:hypothetical protein
MAATKFIVSIRNAKTGQWRDSHETSLAACVALTLGLGTLFVIVRCEDHAEIDNAKGFNQIDRTIRAVNNPLDQDLRKRYEHAKRSLIAKWMKNYRTAAIQTSEDCELYRIELTRSDASLAHSMRVWMGTDSVSIQL